MKNVSESWIENILILEEKKFCFPELLRDELWMIVFLI